MMMAMSSAGGFYGRAVNWYSKFVRERHKFV